MRPRAVGTSAERPSDLAWVGNLLLGRALDADVSIGPTVPSGFREVLTFGALPNAAHPYLLVPLDSRRATGGAVHNVGNPLKRTVRVAESALSIGLALGLAPMIVKQRVSVSVPAAEPAAMTVPGLLAERLDRPDLATAVILGRDRPNRKPVLKLLTPQGRNVAFVKVGWNALSRELVKGEETILKAMERLSVLPGRSRSLA